MNIRFALLCFLSACIGFLWFAYKHEWLIINIPSYLHDRASSQTTEVPITYSYWADGQWNTDTQTVVSTQTTSRILTSLMTSWLTLVHEEGVLKKKVTLQSALVDEKTNIAYLSFKQNPLNPAWSLYEKWMFIEGMLHTIRNAHLPIQQLYILVNHAPLIDDDLDFHHPWPIIGYAGL